MAVKDNLNSVWGGVKHHLYGEHQNHQDPLI